jgi:hypothetical protein
MQINSKSIQKEQEFQISCPESRCNKSRLNWDNIDCSETEKVKEFRKLSFELQKCETW